ncbi:HAD-IA family hydrolase [Candidatus Saccharibacteria bacterium]|jgi:putative hydrolase of the HAD superfamily|nr:HAD-IA family hydrolase [Candidatus Saccharibacteria bacterium]
MIKAVIFDFFGVLASDGWLPFKNKHFGDDPELFAKAGELNKQTDSGLKTYNEFISEISRMASVEPEQARHQIENNIRDDKLLEYIREELKPHYKVGMLSNAAANWLNDILTKEQIALFDAIALSYETGIVKPNPQAFHIITERLGVKPDESIFIDDQERYCVGAEAVGMKFIVYKDFPQLKQELQKLLMPGADN